MQGQPLSDQQSASTPPPSYREQDKKSSSAESESDEEDWAKETHKSSFVKSLQGQSRVLIMLKLSCRSIRIQPRGRRRAHCLRQSSSHKSVPRNVIAASCAHKPQRWKTTELMKLLSWSSWTVSSQSLMEMGDSMLSIPRLQQR